jgi:hypothetical protein
MDNIIESFFFLYKCSTFNKREKYLSSHPLFIYFVLSLALTL